MHVVMVALPMLGHIIPMLDLSLKLASRGVKITFVSSEFTKSKMKPPSCDEGTPPDTDKLYSTISFLHIPDGLPPDDNRNDPFSLLASVGACYGLHFAELLRTQLCAQEPPISCIVGNTLVLHVQEAADSVGLPYVSFWTQSATSFASVLMVAKGYRPPKDLQLFDLFPPDILPSVPGLQIGELNSFLQSYDEEDFMYRLFVAPMWRIMEAGCILMNTFEELESEMVALLREKEHLKVFPIGPLLPQSFFDKANAVSPAKGIWASKDLDCISWLDKQEESSVIYVSFGTTVLISEEQLEEIALGLEASKKTFLWVVRPGLTNAKEVALPKGFLERTAGRGLIVPWVPQLKVLRHPAVAAFLTHCGWNSTLESICAGVPLLCNPVISDQATNCRCATDVWHVGLRLETLGPTPGFVNKEEVEKKVVELMCGTGCEAVRAKACEWKAVATKAVSGSTSLNLQRFIDTYENVGN